MAVLTLPKKLTRPVSAKTGYWADGDGGPGKPGGKEHKAHREQGADFGEAGKRRDNNLYGGFGVWRTERTLPQQFFTALHNERQDNKGAAGGKRRYQHVAGLSDHLPVGERGTTRDQGRQYPQGEQQGHGHIGHHIDL